MRDTLASHGSRRPADGVGTGFPVGEQAGVRAGDLGESSSGLAVAQPFVFVARPPLEMAVEAVEEVGQLGAVEAPVVVDPAGHDRVDQSGQLLEGGPATPTQPPGADLVTDLFLGGFAEGGQISGEQCPGFGRY